MAQQESSMNIRKIVHIVSQEGKSTAMRDALAALQQATRAETGCREFTFYQAITEQESFLLIEDFADQAALDAHMAMPHTKAFFDLGLVAGIRPVERGWLSQ